MARTLDDVFVIPGTRVRFGLDALIGLLVPTAGDAVTGVVSVAVIVVAWRAQVPRVVLARMLLNLGFDALIGAIPVAGDLFDVVWRANRTNVALLRRHAHTNTRRSSWIDHLALAALVTLAVVIVLSPIVLVVLLWQRVFA